MLVCVPRGFESNTGMPEGLVGGSLVCIRTWIVDHAHANTVLWKFKCTIVYEIINRRVYACRLHIAEQLFPGDLELRQMVRCLLMLPWSTLLEEQMHGTFALQSF